LITKLHVLLPCKSALCELPNEQSGHPAILNGQASRICDRLWENPAKDARQNSEKNGKVKKNFFKDAPLIHFIYPKVQKYVQKYIKIAPNVIIKWSMVHVHTWGYMRKKDTAISSEWGIRSCTHIMTLTYFTPE
jgi:hypothetical protein